MEDVKVVTWENNIDYMVVDTISLNDIEYLLLSNMENTLDFCIRIHTCIDETDYLEKLNSKEEFDKIFSLFINKNKDLM